MSKKYESFLDDKLHFGDMDGFAPVWMPDALFDFQKSLCDWAIRKGRCALFEDCGMGKTIQQLVWAENVARKTNKPVLVLTPIAVGNQTVKEAAKFGIEAAISRDGKFKGKIVVTNYERLHYFSSSDFAGVVCDESSILKNFDGKTKAEITEFMRKLSYRLLCTATASPNDYIELGTSSEALGDMGYMDMLSRFFKNDQNSNHPNRLWSGNGKWRFRGHSEHDFWRWVCSWARAIRKPSDLGFDDGDFILPALEIVNRVIECSEVRDGFLFAMPAQDLASQRAERRETLADRCHHAAECITSRKDQSIAWCNLNDEGDLLEKIISGAEQITGSDTKKQSDEQREEIIEGFISGEVKVLVGKPSSLGFGLNFQNCAHQTFFPSHSFEQWYQSIRRSWRFGQKNPVTIDVITSEGEAIVLANLQRKAKNAEEMFTKLVQLMNDELQFQRSNPFQTPQIKPSWL